MTATAGGCRCSDRAAFDGHRGSCFLDLGLPDRALAPSTSQDRHAPAVFARNRVTWHLDRIDAVLDLG
jgi:hypothetical protein